jgi:hypothetical protein
LERLTCWLRKLNYALLQKRKLTGVEIEQILGREQRQMTATTKHPYWKAPFSKQAHELRLMTWS